MFVAEPQRSKDFGKYFESSFNKNKYSWSIKNFKDQRLQMLANIYILHSGVLRTQLII